VVGFTKRLRRKVHLVDSLNQSYLFIEPDDLEKWVETLSPTRRIEDPFLTPPKRTIETPLKLGLSLSRCGDAEGRCNK